MNTLNENQSNEKKENQRSCLERISDLTLKLWDQIGQNAADLAEDDFDFSEGAKKSSSKKSAKSKKNTKTIQAFLSGGVIGALSVLAVTSYMDSLALKETETTRLIQERAAEEQTLTPIAEVDQIPLQDESLLQTAENQNDSEPEVAEVTPDRIETFGVKPRESLAAVLKKGGLTNQEIYHVSLALEEILDLKRIQVGDKVEIGTVKSDAGEDVLFSVTVEDRKNFRYTASRSDEEVFEASLKEPEVELKTEYAESEIEGPFILSAQNAGVPTNVVHQMIWAFDGPVDFERDLRKGDSFTAVFKKEYNMEGNPTGNGELMYASLTLGKKVLERYLYTDSGDHSDYYDETGKIARKLFIMHPLKRPRQTSRFGMRKHPILGYSTMHWGADFGAPIGTPIRAPGEGTVVKAGRLGSYGIYVKIKHNSEYASAYGHMSKIHNKVRVGRKVKAGDIIGYVGNTGRSTGPHLHWELHKNGKRINPLTQKITAQKKLVGTELRRFYAARDKIRADLLGSTTAIAKAEPLPEDRKLAYQGPKKSKKKVRSAKRSSSQKTAARRVKQPKG